MPGKTATNKKRTGKPASKVGSAPALMKAESTKAKKKQSKAVMARQLMEDMDFDPLAASISIAKGEDLQNDHPFLKLFMLTCESFIERLTLKKVIKREHVESFLRYGVEALQNTYTSASMRSSHIQELLKYAYPQLKATELSLAAYGGGEVTPLSAKEVTLFNKKFKDNY